MWKNGYYHPPTKLWQGNVFSRVCPSFCPGGVLCDHYPWCIRLQRTGTLPPTHGPRPMLLTSRSQDRRRIQLVHLRTLPSLVVTSGSYSSRYGGQAGGMHPTGMLSCSQSFQKYRLPMTPVVLNRSHRFILEVQGYQVRREWTLRY